MNKILIGISGVAASGKDTLAKILKKEIQKSISTSDGNLVPVEILSLATALKESVKNEAIDKFGIDPTSCSREEKDKIRDFLVQKGLEKRLETQGMHWINVLTEKINSTNSLIYIIPDIRFKEYDFDEVDFIKQSGGILIHLEREVDGQILPPANETEAKNDPLVKEAADIKITLENLANNPDIDSVIRSLSKLTDLNISVVMNIYKWIVPS